MSRSEWQSRRIVVTKAGVFFTLVGEDQVRDHIPLIEVKHVDKKRELDENSVLGAEVNPPLQANEGTPSLKRVRTFRFFNSLYIETIEDGYNSGRIYHIQAETTEICTNAVTMIHDFSRRAKSLAITKSRFQKSQQAVLRIYTSFWFQSVAVSLILAVRRPKRHRSSRPPRPALTRSSLVHRRRTSASTSTLRRSPPSPT